MPDFGTFSFIVSRLREPSDTSHFINYSKAVCEDNYKKKQKNVFMFKIKFKKQKHQFNLETQPSRVESSKKQKKLFPARPGPLSLSPSLSPCPLVEQLSFKALKQYQFFNNNPCRRVELRKVFSSNHALDFN